MKTVWVVYSQFIDDPSLIKGIFEKEEDALECYENYKDRCKSIAEIELNTVFEKEISLD